MFGNATLLSLVYLALGVVFELVRRLYPAPWVMRAVLVLDSLPARTLDLLGWMEPLRHAYVYGQISETSLRIIFSGTTIAVIFLMAVVVGAGMWVVRRLLYRRYA
jgi:hypothetical protein